MRPIYVETLVRAGLEPLWRATQDPGEHQRWDARFGRISYLPRPDGQPQRFRYATTVLPGLTVHGVGVSAGERVRPDGTRTSVLRFRAEHPLSLVDTGSGYWRYVPVPGGTRFLTGYDYRPGWGRPGTVADRLFRPVFGWLTAWSFDRLRLWLDHGIDPRRSLAHALAETAVRAAVTVAAALLGGPVAGLAAGVLALAVPPHPATPAARRCLRRPPDRTAATAPARLDPLEQP
ncbi:hypothetical protein Cs7R123_24480 [Catellatospora sp. TT07R-123]|uniref:hypothetical protein n=1 Tax=Catellatospora sp. TT07R-123 TaxID=2733863 RepID=UPI001B115D47|nr:hypothetical protein [Catellatospora sp. TT07R-123]GHJ45106.1 hypothetical protein Cs7R123_24480 [Catellatospora sp. TT07R-123]